LGVVFLLLIAEQYLFLFIFTVNSARKYQLFRTIDYFSTACKFDLAVNL